MLSNCKAQGSLEYLLLIGGAILVAVIVIGLVISTAGMQEESIQENVGLWESLLGRKPLKVESHGGYGTNVDFAKITVGDTVVLDTIANPIPYVRGFAIVVVDKSTRNVIPPTKINYEIANESVFCPAGKDYCFFDTYCPSTEQYCKNRYGTGSNAHCLGVNKLTEYIDSIEEGSIVLLAAKTDWSLSFKCEYVCDEFKRCVGRGCNEVEKPCDEDYDGDTINDITEAFNALNSIDAGLLKTKPRYSWWSAFLEPPPEPEQSVFRSSYALISIKGEGKIAEEYKERSNGPATVVSTRS